MGPHLSPHLLPDKPARPHREIQEVEQTARRALAEVRQTIRGYRTEGLAAEVRARHPDTQAVILTTFARPGYLRRGLETRANGYLLKDRSALELAAPSG